MSNSSSPDPLPCDATLASWRVDPPRNPSFRSDVWARIEADRRPTTWGRFVRAHPAAVAAMLAVGLALGAWSGRTEARDRLESDRSQLAASYVHSLDARWMRNP
jgi:hypothetical protein